MNFLVLPLLGKLLRFCFPSVFFWLIFPYLYDIEFPKSNLINSQNFEMFLLYTSIYAFTESDGIKNFAEHVLNLVQGYSVQNYYCAYVTFLCRKQLEDILSNLKEKPDVGTLLLVSHQKIKYWPCCHNNCFTCYTWEAGLGWTENT